MIQTLIEYRQLALARTKMTDISGLPKSKAFRVFVFVFMFFLILMEVTLSSLRTVGILGSFGVVVTIGVYAICLISLSIWYLVTAIRILRFVHFSFL
jgi:hypothetical protein